MSDTVTLSIIVLTYNEERNIAECLESAKWADEIIVVDRYSEDNTVEVAKRYTDKVFLQEWLGFANQRNFALTEASGKWAFFLDADERITPELKESLLNEIARSTNNVAYKVKNLNVFMGKTLKSFVESHLRLFRNGSVSFSGEVHETPHFEGTVGALRGYLWHYSYTSLEGYSHKLIKYANLSANTRYSLGKKSMVSDIIFRPLFDFVKFYFIKGGFKDGLPGFIFCITHAHYTFLKYAILFEKYN